MAGGKSAYLEAALLNCAGGASFPATPATFYVALSTAVWAVAATGSSMSEVPTGLGYARVAVTNNSTNWPAATGSNPGTKKNGSVITFPTATGTWGLCQSWYVVDASSAGNIWFGAPLSTNKSPLSGDIAAFAVGALIWTEV